MPTFLLKLTHSAPDEHKQYRTVVGKPCTRQGSHAPDISNSVNLLGRFLESPTKVQWIALNHLLEYLAQRKTCTLN